MKATRTLFAAALLLLLHSATASAQRFGVGTNALDWLALGTINAEASIAVSQKVSVHVGGELNPWTWRAGHVYSGWWVGADARYTLYNVGGILKRSTEEGDAAGAGLYGGYSIMLSEWWNLDLGVGLWGGWKRYTRYACPLCGVITEQGEKGFILPDARVAVQFIF